MKIGVRYQTRGGNTKAVAEIIAKSFEIQALSIDNPIEEYVDVLFIGGGVYGWKMDKSLRNFLEKLSPQKVGQIIPFSTSGLMDNTLRQLIEIANFKGIKTNEHQLLVKMKLRGHSALGLTGGKLTAGQEKKVLSFIKNTGGTIMESYVWLFPILFIFHDMEEIVGFIPWFKRNNKILNHKYPAIVRVYKNTSTEGFAFAVFEELIICIIICIISVVRKRYELWLGCFIGCTFHFAIHIIQSIVIKKYIPALLTSIVALPIGCAIIYNCLKILNYSTIALFLYSLIGIILLLFNLIVAHTIMNKFSIWLKRESSEN